MVVQIAALSLAAKSSYASANELMMTVGAQMMRLAGAVRQDQPRTIVLNGLALRFTSGSTEAPVSAVLDFFQARCRERNGRFAEQFREITRGRPGMRVSNDPPLGNGVLRYIVGHQGTVACLDTGGQKLEPAEIIGRIRRFLSTGELSDIGELRYVMAERQGEVTSFITFWTEGSANIFRAFGSGGDAPGLDPLYIPRPPKARRLISAWEQNQAPALTVYATSSLDLGNLARFYRERLGQLGWKVVGHGANVTRSSQTAIFAEREGHTATFTFSIARDHRAMVTVLETG
jgi:hypothetical protein